MELRHLRYFVTVARELHFTRAADLLCIGQPPLSQQIQQLEQEIGTALFIRNRRGVALTDAGKVFLTEAEMVLDGAAHAIESARRVARGEIGAIRIGFTVSASIHPFVPRFVKNYRELYPGVGVTLYEQTSVDCVESIRKGALDLAFIRTPTEPSDGVTIETILREPMVAVVPTGHKLGGKQSIELAELSSDTFIMYPRRIGFGVFDAVVTACERAGFSPTLGQEAPQLSSIISLVAAGMGVSVVPSTMSQYRAEGVTYLTLSGSTPFAQIGIAFRTSAHAPALEYAKALAFESAAATNASKPSNSKS
jgi:DNA-binding transcriptional LysR family regulator